MFPAIRFSFLCLLFAKVAANISLESIKCILPQPDKSIWVIGGTYIPNTSYFCKKVGYGKCFHQPASTEDIDDDSFNVDIQQLRDKINKDEACIIDVRTLEEVEAGRIFGQRWIHVPVNEIESAFKLGKRKFKEKYGFFKPKKGEEIIFHCRSGKRSKVALNTVVKLGFKKAKHYPGGWLEWTAHIAGNS